MCSTLVTSWTWQKDVQRLIKMATFMFLNALRAWKWLPVIFSMLLESVVKQTCGSAATVNAVVASYVHTDLVESENSFLQMFSLSHYSLVVALFLIMLLIWHTFYYKGQRGKGKRKEEGREEGRKEGRGDGRKEGRGDGRKEGKKVQISWSMNLSVQLRHCMMKSHSLKMQ